MVAEIEKARELGFCYGVRRAIKIIQAAAKEHEGISTLGPIVHNRLVVEKLADMGISSVNNLSQVKAKSVAISSNSEAQI
jgi:4-hydroxy-3-methylbut-2-enyl diphosphate reductase